MKSQGLNVCYASVFLILISLILLVLYRSSFCGNSSASFAGPSEPETSGEMYLAEHANKRKIIYVNDDLKNMAMKSCVEEHHINSRWDSYDQCLIAAKIIPPHMYKPPAQL